MAQKIDDEVIEKIQPVHGNTLGELLGKYAIAKMAQNGIIRGGDAEADIEPEPEPEPEPTPEPTPEPEWPERLSCVVERLDAIIYRLDQNIIPNM